MAFYGPTEFYDEFLKGKKASEIKKYINTLNREIEYFKKDMGHAYDNDPVLSSEIRVGLSMARLNLMMAKKAYRDAGGKYKPSQAELDADDFGNNVLAINKIVFIIGTHSNDFEKGHSILPMNTYIWMSATATCQSYQISISSQIIQ